MDAAAIVFGRPFKWSMLKRLFDKMMEQKDRIWDLCETLDHHRPSLRKARCEVFPTTPSEHGAEGYTAQTGEQHLLNHQLLQKLEAIIYTPWRKGPAPKKGATKPAKRSKSYLQQAKLTLRGPRKLAPPVAFCDLSESDDPDYETTEDEDEEGGEEEEKGEDEGEDEVMKMMKEEE